MTDILILLLLITASIWDFKKREVPIFCQVALMLFLPFVYVNGNVWGTLIALPFFISACITEGMGGGDWKMIGLLGLCFGFVKTFQVTVIGCIIFVISGYIMQKCKGKEKVFFPFVPALTAGYIIELILEVYRHWIR